MPRSHYAVSAAIYFPIVGLLVRSYSKDKALRAHDILYSFLWPLELIGTLLIASVALFELSLKLGSERFSSTWLGRRIAAYGLRDKLKR